MWAQFKPSLYRQWSFVWGLIGGFFCVSCLQLKQLRRTTHCQLIQKKPLTRPHWSYNYFKLKASYKQNTPNTNLLLLKLVFHNVRDRNKNGLIGCRCTRINFFEDLKYFLHARETSANSRDNGVSSSSSRNLSSSSISGSCRTWGIYFYQIDWPPDSKK